LKGITKIFGGRFSVPSCLSSTFWGRTLNTIALPKNLLERLEKVAQGSHIKPEILSSAP
jgi:hypothetical protein